MADIVERVGNKMNLDVERQSIPNPRKEPEDHYYNPKHTGLIELGLEPHYMTDEVVEKVHARRGKSKYRDLYYGGKFVPRVNWNEESKEA
ncbi:MAG: hypothetical protein U5J63_08170 [Fodinibius sp.]|nr:hypothetical protein [Fodinibius sp.]